MSGRLTAANAFCALGNNIAFQRHTSGCCCCFFFDLVFTGTIATPHCFHEAGFLGKNLLEGLWNGIKNMKDWLIRKIKSLGSAVTEAMKSVLGIHSPSTVFRDQIGKNMALGVGVGFETTMRDVAKRMTDSIPMDVDINATGNFTARRAQAAVSGGNKVYNFNVTINAADGGGDVRALASRIAEEIYDEMRRKERAYA